MANLVESRRLFEQALSLMPGGVNSPVRAWGAVGLTPPRLMARGAGARVYDLDGNSYLDYIGSWGPLSWGTPPRKWWPRSRRPPPEGLGFGASTPGEVELAQLLVEAVPSLEMVRLVTSGTEACMSALRLARGATGRPRVLKFDGCYHGHADSFLVAAGSGVLTQAIPGSPGVPAGNRRPDHVPALQRPGGGEGGGAAPPRRDRRPHRGADSRQHGGGAAPAGFSGGLAADLCHQQDIILIFDEVISGFRAAWGGAQALYGVTPDLTCLGKIIGGGLPVGAYGGRRELMSQMAPSGPIYQAGTLSGNPVAVAAGLATLKVLQAARHLRATGGQRRLAGRGAGPGRGARRAWTSPSTGPGRCSPCSLPGGRCHDLEDAKQSDLQPLPAVLPGDAGRGDLPAALPIRGLVHLPGPHRRRPGADRGRRPAGLVPVAG